MDRLRLDKMGTIPIVISRLITGNFFRQNPVTVTLHVGEIKVIG